MIRQLEDGTYAVSALLRFEATDDLKNTFAKPSRERLSQAARIVQSAKIISSVDFGQNAIPTGRMSTENVESEYSTLETTEGLAFRAELKVEDPEHIPEFIDGTQVFSDPVVSTCTACFDDSPIGDSEEVRSLLALQELQDAGYNGENVAIAIIDGGIDITYLRQKFGRPLSIDLNYSWVPDGIDTTLGHKMGTNPENEAEKGI